MCDWKSQVTKKFIHGTLTSWCLDKTRKVSSSIPHYLTNPVLPNLPYRNPSVDVVISESLPGPRNFRLQSEFTCPSKNSSEYSSDFSFLGMNKRRLSGRPPLSQPTKSLKMSDDEDLFRPKNTFVILFLQEKNPIDAHSSFEWKAILK